jgi:osmotically-inducible protein OsmY
VHLLSTTSLKHLAIILLLGTTGCRSTVDGDYSRLDDDRNEAIALRNIKASHPGLADANISVTSYNGFVLITGQVNTPEQITQAGAAVSQMRNVRKVHNELVVAGPTTLLSRTNDRFLSTKVNKALLGSDEIDSSRIKVMTENGVVYLMGVVSRQEADLAVDAARQVYGIQKIVKVFDYLN